MNSLVILLIGIVIFIIAYVTYGAWLAKQWGINLNAKTPAHTKNDGVDYCPAKAPVLLGHHFASIAGAGPILGPIQASIFGWLPVLLWIIIGGIFFGGVQDFSSLFASVRHGGKSIGEIIEINIGKSGKKLFGIFAWLTLLLVIAAFTSIVADTFVSTPAAATASLLFIILAVVFGFGVYRRNLPLGISSVAGVVLLFICIWIGNIAPIKLSKQTWEVILLIYVFIASVTPVWILLQPRDYLNSFLLYAMMGGAFLGILIMRPNLQMQAVTSFNVNGQYLFPMLFVIVACGAISGFHSLVGSGTSSKQLDNENDAKIVGYGGMLIECVLAIIALITAAYITSGDLGNLMKNGGPIKVFATGVGHFMSSFGIPAETGTTFSALALSAFALTSLDTATRLGRFIFQEFFQDESGKEESFITNRYVATLITVIFGGWLAFAGWQKVWPLFGSANQLLAALALLAVAAWLGNIGKNNKMFFVPMAFMLLATLTAIVLTVKSNILNYKSFGTNGILIVFASLLFVLAIVLTVQAVQVLNKPKKVNQSADAGM